MKYEDIEVTLSLPAKAKHLAKVLEGCNRAVVGVDPGMKTGIAACILLYDGTWGVAHVSTTTPIEAAVVLSALCRGSKKVVVAVEDARLRKHYGAEEKIIYSKLRSGLRVSHDELNRYKGRLLGAGYVQASSALIIDTLKRNDVRVVRVMPGFARTKMDAEAFKKVSKYEGRTNSHERDAANIAMLPILRHHSNLFDTEDVVIQ